MSDALCVKLPDRASVIISGPDRVSFLQNLVTQDIAKLDTIPLLYGCLLTPQGKFLFDFFIRKQDECLVLDCENGIRADALLKKLSLYKLHADVALDVRQDTDVWQIWNTDSAEGLPDPRSVICGYRSYSKPENIKVADFSLWDEYRIRNEIPDGSRDLIPEQSYIFEGHLDKLNAVSFTKGCYIGQELVSRVYHRGLVKKVLRCVKIDEENTLQNDLRSHCNGYGLVLKKI